MLAIAEKTGIYPSTLLRSATLRIYDCGLANYRDVLQQQHEFRDKRRRGEIPNTVLIAEHPAVITLGARQNANKLRTGRESLKEQNIDVVDIRRGGGTTAHNPGQLVFYPILNLREVELGISEYIRKLEEIGIELLEQLGVSAERRKGFPGLWANNRKIASIGVRISKSVTYHGMAINIRNDLSIFDHIIPCGLDEVEMTSVLTETGREHSMAEVKRKLSQLLIRHLSKPNEQRAANYQRRKLPEWLKRPLPANENYNHTKGVLSLPGLETICDNANCPNRGECWARGTATVLILGNVCTRNCKFCSVASGKPQPPDPDEPARIAEMTKKLGLKYLVITSVTRDDLADGGAEHFRNCINTVRHKSPDMQFEILTPDFRHCQERAIEILAGALPFVFAHNVETVPALYPAARAGGDYQSSLNLLKMAKQSYKDVLTKSSIMLGLGETDAEVEQVLKDLRDAGCDRITIGQYLKPSKDSLDVVEYITPQKFEWWKQKAISRGFSWVMSSPFTRSSYFAERENIL
jgi:lipoic acid synthetase